MKKTRKLLSVVLALAMLLSTFSTVAFASSDATTISSDETITQETPLMAEGPLSIEVSTDKNLYGTIGVADVTVTITNTSGAAIENISAETVFNEISPIGASSDLTAEADSLASGESIVYSYKATLSLSNINLGLFSKIFLLIKRLFSVIPTVKENGFDDGRACIENVSTINFGGIEAENLVKVWYGSNSKELTANEKEFYVSSNSEKVIFYAKSELTDAEIYLCNGNDEVIAQMYDNGNYSSNGDDMQGDGIYSAIVSINCNAEKTYSYSALINNEKRTNYVEIDIIAPLTNTEVAQMETVQTEIENLTTSDDFNSKNETEQVAQISSLLSDMAESNNSYGEAMIDSDSIIHDEENDAFYFTYSCGVGGGFIYSETDDMLAGPSSMNNTTGTPSVMALNSSATANGNSTNAGEAVIAYGWNTDYSANSEFYKPYLDMESDWEAKGLDTTVETAVTVEEYKTVFSGKDLIVIAEHGSRYTYYTDSYSTKTVSIFSTHESVTNEMSKNLSADLKQNRVFPLKFKESDGSVSTAYCLSPDFFSYYYEDELTDAIVYFGSCKGFGEGSVVDYSFADAFNDDCGASATIGFHNSVYIWYEIKILDKMAEELLEGETLATAIEEATDLYGDNDLVFANKYTTWDTTEHVAATLCTSGDMNATLISSGLENGSFEEASTPTKWNYGGDVRVINMLGESAPQDGKKMAVISTGIGSKEDDYLNGTEGSFIEQTFIVPLKADTLSFTYNVVSEEPMEYVNSSYDDKFYAQIYDANGNMVQTAAEETINTSTWHVVENIDFAGGDSTTYHTTWQTVNVDVSDYKGKMITLRFVVYDVGDSLYDTAALIDNVTID